MTDLQAGVWVVALGAAVGSFLNVCIYRLPRGESVVSPPSHCPSCCRRLKWFENVPVLGWLIVGGRCRGCRTAVSPTYPIVESLTALVFFFQYASLGWQPLLAVRLAFAGAMVVLCVIDLNHRILPNAITLPGILLGLMASVFLEPGWRDSLIGVVAGGGLLWLVGEIYFWLRGEEGMGMGDVKMLAMVGAFLGWQGMLVTLLLASLGGSLVGGLLIASRRRNLKYALPFGSFLAVGALLTTQVGRALISWYLGFY